MSSRCSGSQSRSKTSCLARFFFPKEYARSEDPKLRRIGLKERLAAKEVEKAPATPTSQVVTPAQDAVSAEKAIAGCDNTVSVGITADVEKGEEDVEGLSVTEDGEEAVVAQVEDEETVTS